ncbi:MAG: hypothetical protein LBF36_02730 [Mycoplasmataceae bacterium]|jgi:hypothetical protein|nr:hypothetical protein [Mycoplasmataceae bacterium]
MKLSKFVSNDEVECKVNDIETWKVSYDDKTKNDEWRIKVLEVIEKNSLIKIQILKSKKDPKITGHKITVRFKETKLLN